MSFDTVPILDLALSRDPITKPAFLSSLRHALLTVGFFYIRNTGIDARLIQNVVEQGKAFFDLPQEEKLQIQMKNVPSFLGGFPIFPFKTSVSVSFAIQSKLVICYGRKEQGFRVLR